MHSRSVLSSPDVAAACLTACALIVAACSQSPTSPSNTTITVTGAGIATYTYAGQVQPILSADCVTCHGPSRRESGVDLSTYAGVLKVLTVGSDASTLVRVTQPGGLMYGNLSGNRTQKAGIIYDWVVNSKAAQ